MSDKRAHVMKFKSIFKKNQYSTLNNPLSWADQKGTTGELSMQSTQFDKKLLSDRFNYQTRPSWNQTSVSSKFLGHSHSQGALPTLRKNTPLTLDKLPMRITKSVGKLRGLVPRKNVTGMWTTREAKKNGDDPHDRYLYFQDWEDRELYQHGRHDPVTVANLPNN